MRASAHQYHHKYISTSEYFDWDFMEIYRKAAKEKSNGKDAQEDNQILVDKRVRFVSEHGNGCGNQTHDTCH